MAEAALSRTVVSADTLSDRVSELGRQIADDYRGRSLLVVGVLKGAAIFTVDLARHVDLPLTLDWVSISTYGVGDSAGQRRVRSEIDEDVAGRDVLVVEDILDTGGTLSWLMGRI